MKADLRLSPGAKADFDQASDWHWEQDPELQPQFVEAVHQTFARIVDSPLAFPVVFGSHVRRAKVKRFFVHNSLLG